MILSIFSGLNNFNSLNKEIRNFMEDLGLARYWNLIIDMTVAYIHKFLLALIVLFIGLKIIGGVIIPFTQVDVHLNKL